LAQRIRLGQIRNRKSAIRNSTGGTSVKLHEYQSKRIFAKYGIPIPRGQVATTPEEAHQIAADLGGRVVVKSQVLVGGRGKAGGIKLADTPTRPSGWPKKSWA
jgi:succinyl-CoA synthetase beta subunit